MVEPLEHLDHAKHPDLDQDPGISLSTSPVTSPGARPVQAFAKSSGLTVPIGCCGPACTVGNFSPCGGDAARPVVELAGGSKPSHDAQSGSPPDALDGKHGIAHAVLGADLNAHSRRDVAHRGLCRGPDRHSQSIGNEPVARQWVRAKATLMRWLSSPMMRNQRPPRRCSRQGSRAARSLGSSRPRPPACRSAVSAIPYCCTSTTRSIQSCVGRRSAALRQTRVELRVVRLVRRRRVVAGVGAEVFRG